MIMFARALRVMFTPNSIISHLIANRHLSYDFAEFEQVFAESKSEADCVANVNAKHHSHFVAEVLCSHSAPLAVICPCVVSLCATTKVSCMPIKSHSIFYWFVVVVYFVMSVYKNCIYYFLSV